MQHPSRLYIDPAHQPAAFAACAFLADHVWAIRKGRPVQLVAGILTDPDGAQQCVSIRYADTGEPLGWAVIGDPPLPNRVQVQKLEAALASLDPARAPRVA